MSLGGIAIAIGAMIDAAIVMIENAHKHLERAPPDKPRLEIFVEAAIEVGPALFFSLLIITVSFLPIFTLEAQEGRLFGPLAYTKTFAMAAAALLSITLVPALMVLFVRGRIIPEHRNPLNRFLIAIYRPVIRLVLQAKTLTIVIALAVLAVSIWPVTRLGTEFMPNLNEGTLLYMPTTLPGLSVTKSAELLQMQDRIIQSFPEVELVYGKAGRAQTATDPAPIEMFETVINLKPKEQWRPGLTIDSLIQEMDRSLQFPGVSNAWTMPIKARIDMLSTGIRTPVGVKVIGKDLVEMEKVAREVEKALKTVQGTASAYAERIVGGYYLEIIPDRDRLARYGLMVSDVQDVVATALGAEPITTTVEGRERYTVAIRYPRDLRSDPQSIAKDVLVALPSGGGTVPLGEVADIRLTQGATSIRTENARLATYIFVDIRDRDLGGYVAAAQKAVAEQVQLPAGTYLVWSGQFEYLQRAEARLQVVVPVTLMIIFLLLYLNFRRLTETLIVMLSLPFAPVATASGGPFRDWPLGRMASVTPEQARAHPNWDMGERISIDSATMFNKALEVIEAHAFFDVGLDRIEVLIHPQSIVHSMVRFRDGAIMAHLGPSDMRGAIGYALNWPERRELPVERLDFAALARLDFAPADPTRFPALRLAGQVLEHGGLAGAVFNAAKEAALDAFLLGAIGFLDMAVLVEHVLEKLGPEAGAHGPDYGLEAVTALDAAAREMSGLWVEAFSGK